MIQLLSIVVLIVLAFVLIKYKTNERLQKGIIIGILSVFILYLGILVITELIR